MLEAWGNHNGSGLGARGSVLESARGNGLLHYPMDPTRTTDPQATPGRTPSHSTHGRFGPGAMLGDRYRIIGLLGAGGMGEVYRADDLKLDQPVALKFLSEEIEDDPVRLERFLAEIRTARQVSHPNVCRVHDIAEVDGRHFLSMEYIDGEDLSSLLRRIGRLPQDKALDVARQICAGLAASHDRGVLHRDLKPANVMLDGRGKARITDFGLAGALTDFTDRAGEISGTPAYMAPEQLAGEPLSVQTDLYALGLLLFEIFTGRRRTKDAPGGDLDPAIERTIERCLERDPRRRPPSAIAVAASLPGGDPLAAALAAGETPSPQMVAAAGDDGAISPRVALASLAVFLLMLPLVASLTARSTHLAFAPMPDPPHVLALKAQQMAERLGYGDTAVDSASGFARSLDLPEWIQANDQSPGRWQRLAAALPPSVSFWYRTSRSALAPRVFLGADGHTGAVRVTTTDPPRAQPGSVYVELHPDGRLVRLEAVPEETKNTEQRTRNTEGVKGQDVDWARVFGEAGLDLRQFTPATPQLLPPVYADARRAWTGPAPDRANGPLRVEAASFNGRPVFFTLVAPWAPAADAPRAGGQGRVAGGVSIIGFLLIIAATIGLTRRNIRLGRGDRRGALRLAFASGILLFASAMLSSDHVAAPSELAVVLMALSWVLFVGAFAWLAYLAIEPSVRRRWPHVLISWTRLLSGQWRDPLIGRDLLLGSAAGLILSLPQHLSRLLSVWRTVPPARPTAPHWETFEGATAALGDVLHVATEAVFVGVVVLLLLFIARMIVRNQKAAVILVIAAAVALALPSMQDRVIEVPMTTVVVTAWIAVMLRLGLLAFWSGTFVGSIWSDFQPALGVSDFASPTMIVALVALLAPAFFGFYTSVGGRPLLSARLLED